MEYFSFHHSVIGASHIDKGKECQDCSDSFQIDRVSAMVVCDGHGGSNYFRSSRGSKFACQAFRQCITNEAFLESLSADNFYEEHKERLSRLIMSIIAVWNQLVENDISNDPFRDEELTDVAPKYQEYYRSGKRQECAYGTTLIGAVLTDKFWFGIHIGDGKCVVLDQDDQFTQPIPWDEKCFLNQTTSMCDSNVYESFRYYCSQELPKAIFIASDGIDDCFASANEETANAWLHGFYNTVAIQLGKNSFEQAKKDLFAYLPILSKKGSRDDMSLAGIVCLSQLAQRIPALQESKNTPAEAPAQNPEAAENAAEPAEPAEPIESEEAAEPDAEETEPKKEDQSKTEIQES